MHTCTFRANARALRHTEPDNTWPPLIRRAASQCQKCSYGAARAGIVEMPNIHLVFHPTGSSPQKRKHQAITEPDIEPTSYLSSDSSITVDTSSSEGEDEKDFILPDYPSDELSDSELEDRKDTGRHIVSVGPHRPPKHPIPYHQPKHHTFLPQLFLNPNFWRLQANKPVSRLIEQVKQSKPTSN